MLIELINNAADEVTVPMGGKLIRNEPDPREVYKGNTRIYVFQRDEAGAPLTSNIDDERDIRVMLAIREGYQPHGEAAEKEAAEKYDWSPDMPALSEADLPPGQPPVVEEILDDDDDTGERLPDLDHDGQGGPGPDAVVDEEGNATGMPAVPPGDAPDDAWIHYGQSIVENPQDKKALEDYCKKNYGIDLDRRLAPLTLIKEIGKAQRAADAD